MPPKPQASKKAVDKAKAKIIEDKTFGLKNKNRSAKVQKYVQQVTAAVKQGSQADKKKAAELEQKKSAKEAKAAFEAEMADLFKAVPKEHDSDDDGSEGTHDSQDGCAPDEYLWRPEDFEEVEADGRLEERLEQERAALIGRTDLTPVTADTFRAWKERKLREKQEAEAARIRRAKESGTGMKGVDLWEHDRSLFVDDDDADAFYEREDVGGLNEEDDDDAGAAAPSRHIDPAAAA